MVATYSFNPAKTSARSVTQVVSPGVLMTAFVDSNLGISMAAVTSWIPVLPFGGK
jgi:hypothetical protein